MSSDTGATAVVRVGLEGGIVRLRNVYLHVLPIVPPCVLPRASATATATAKGR